MENTIKWKQMFNGDFKKYLDFVVSLKTKLEKLDLSKLPEDKKEALCKRYEKLFSLSCDLLGEYLSYNGIFAGDKSQIIKFAFNTELIDDGQKWINLFFLFNRFKKEGYEKSGKFILLHLNADYITLFENLNNHFEKECKQIN